MTDWQRISAKKLLFVTGKGGTGKTLFTASLAMKLAAAGRRVLVVESTTMEQLPRFFGHNEPVGHNEVQLRHNITAINLNFRDCFREYVANYLGMAKLYEKVFDRSIVRSFLEALPGLGEVMLLGRLFHTCSLRDSFDNVLFDAPATGHFTDLLSTPDALLASGLIGPLVAEVGRVKNYISNPDNAGVVFLSLAEPLVVNESLELAQLLESLVPVKLVGIFLNRIYKDVDQKITALENAPLSGELKGFLQRRLSQMQQSANELSAGISKLNFPLSYLPEVGVLPKTIDAQFASAFLG